MSIIWTIIIGFVAGVIAKFIMPGDNEPSGFILTTILGIVGAFVATYLGQSLGWYRPGEARTGGGGGRRHYRAFRLRFCSRSQPSGHLTTVNGIPRVSGEFARRERRSAR